VRTRTFGSVSASLGALYALTGSRVGASVARAYRTPDTGELFSQGPHLAAYSFEVGNPDLDAETGLGVDAFLRLRGDWFSGEVAVFRNASTTTSTTATRHRTMQRTGLPIYQATGADAVLTGFELSGSAEPVRHIGLTGVVSYVRGTLTADRQPLPFMIRRCRAGSLPLRAARLLRSAGRGGRRPPRSGSRRRSSRLPTPGYTCSTPTQACAG
jgi:iron complex outermembrane recepter protein